MIFVGGFFVAVFLFFTTPVVFAQSESDNAIQLGLVYGQESGLGTDDVRLIIARIIRAVLGLLGVLSLSLIIYAGYTIMTAAGNEEKVAQGKKILINAVIGLAIILSSLAVTQFIINALMKATGMLTEESGPTGPKIEYFSGAGGLGDIVKDHYPMRNQTGVKRNTKIIITFRESMDPGSFIDNSNQTCWAEDGSGPTIICKKDSQGNIINPYYGDCLTNEQDFDWEKHCDHLKIDPANFLIYNADEKDKEGNLLKTPITAVAMASYDKDKNADTFVFRPFKTLGNDVNNVWYAVHLNNNIKKKDGQGAFDGLHYKYYEWEFQTDTNFDFAPPYVTSVYPGKDATVPRNSIVQINFSEPMDPMVVQGVLEKGANIAQVDFTNIIFNTTTIGGEWRIANGYKSVEFVSDEKCGQNSCGENMYCLPVGCKPKDCVDDTYATLIRTAQRLPGVQTFEAIPFSGVMDVSGNALDGDKDGAYDGLPTKGQNGNFQLINEKEEFKADNYWWNFKVKNWIDRVAPYIKKVWPGLDAGGVNKNEDVSITFSKMMWLSTLYEIDLVEHPRAMIGKNEVSFYHFIFSEISRDINKKEELTTLTKISHREFGPNGMDFYYFPVIPHSVKSVNQNCLYPGFGPGGVELMLGAVPICNITNFSDDGTPLKDGMTGCIPEISFADPNKDTGCVQTVEKDIITGVPIQTSASTSTCLEYLELEEISPPFTSVK